MSLFSLKRKGQLSIVFDIGSASVGASLVVFNEDKKPKVLLNIRKEFLTKKKLSVENLKSSLVKAISEVCIQIKKNSLSHLTFTEFGSSTPKHFYCSLSSPWYTSESRKISVVKKKSFKTTKEFMGSLIKKEIINFEEQNGGLEENKIVERRIVQVKLNGYETANPVNKIARELSISLYLSIVPKEILNIVEKEISKSFSIKKIEFSSFSLASFNIVRDVFDTQDFTYIDISGEVTDVSVIKDGVISKMASFPIGRNSLVRKLAKKTNKTMDEALSSLIIHTESRGISEKENTKTPDVFKEVETVWLKGFESSLEQISEEISLPSHIFLTGNKKLIPWYISMLTNEEFYQYNKMEGILKTRGLDSNVLIGRFYKTGKDVVPDAFLGIEVVFFNKIFNNNE